MNLLTRGFRHICRHHRTRCYSDFPKDDHSKFKYWEQEYSAARKNDDVAEDERDDDAYHSMYEGKAKGALLLSHVDSEGRAKMVDVSHKSDTVRTAVARARVELGREAFDLVRNNAVAKGDVLSVAQISGIMGAKKTSDLIPLCHPLPLSSVDVTLKLDEEAAAVEVECEARCTGKTGVEMEAMVGASVAALAVYDMCKAVDKGITIREVKLVRKSGGKSGVYEAKVD